MKLFILLTCILLQAFNIRFFANRYRFFDLYISQIKPLLTKLGLEQGWKAIIGVLAPLLLLVIILNAIFMHLGFFYYLYGVLVLMLCLDVTDVKHKLADYFTALNTDNRTRTQVEVEKFISHSVDADKSTMIRVMTGAIFVQALTNIFSVIFWFLLLGPFGAMFYYLVAAMNERVTRDDLNADEPEQTANYLKDILDWIPVRLMTFTFALIGHFTPVMSLWLEHLGDGVSNNSTLLIDGGLIALDLPTDMAAADIEENQRAMGLVTRSLWTWVITITLLNIAGWLL